MDDTNNVGFLLHDIARYYRARFDQRARALGVTRQQWRVLLHLARRPALSQAELADLLEVERITLCRMIDRLAEAGFVERRGDPTDRRVWRLHLTPVADGVVDRLAQIGREIEAEALRFLNGDEQAMTRSLLMRVREGLCTSEIQDTAATA